MATLIKYLLSDTSNIKNKQPNTTSFNKTIDAPQGDSLSPILFCIYLSEAISKLPTSMSNKDDIDLYNEEVPNLTSITKTMDIFNLKVNTNKT